jgi:hypothetical protein
MGSSAFITVLVRRLSQAGITAVRAISITGLAGARTLAP